MLSEGVIFRSLSGFYDVETGKEDTFRCRARGKFRRDGISPLVGDRVSILRESDGTGTVMEILPRKNEFIRPPVANVDVMVIFATTVNPVTVPFLIDCMAAVAEERDCVPIICINKTDADPADCLYTLYRDAGFETVRTSAVTGEGVEDLRRCIAGRTCVFTGNSGVGKSSILNALEPGISLKVGEVSKRLGRGRHTTRHVELYRLSCGAKVADTPGFAAFDSELMDLNDPLRLERAFRDFAPYLGRCRFLDCCHGKEQGCAVREAVGTGQIAQSRYDSYLRLLENIRRTKPWEKKNQRAE